MSAETIPAGVATDLDCIRWYVECLDAVAFKRRAVAGLAEAEGSYNAAMKRLTDRSTRPAEPAAPVAEVKAWLLGDPATGQWIEVDGNRVEYSRGMGTPAHVLASAFQAERARADAAEQERDWQYAENVARIAAQGAAEQRAADALARAENAAEDERDRLFAKIMEEGPFMRPEHDQGIRQFLQSERATMPADRALLRASREAQPATDGGE